MAATRTLIALPYSPWSERARWALLHHRLSFIERSYLPMLGEPWLRWRAGRLTKKATVPLLLVEKQAFGDSVAIVQYADAHGEGTPLFPPALGDDLRTLCDETEPLFHAGRAYGIEKLFEHDDAARAMLPRALRKMPLSASVSRLGSRYVARKYTISFDALTFRIRGGLERIRGRLEGRDYVFERFSYADILFATAMQFVSPVSGDYVRIASAVRQHWRIAAFETEFRDLLEWRDRIYEKHRPQQTA